jgi:hypothetical protein
MKRITQENSSKPCFVRSKWKKFQKIDKKKECNMTKRVKNEEQENHFNQVVVEQDKKL